MAAVDFPDIEPSARSFNPGEFPRTLFQSQNGAITAVYFGNRPTTPTLELTFQNIVDDLAHKIINHYKKCNRADSNGEWNYARFPRTASGVLAGIGDPELLTTIGAPEERHRYRYAKAPDIVSTFPGYSTVTVSMIAMLEPAGARID